MRRSFGLFVLTLAALACLASCDPVVQWCQPTYSWTDGGECTATITQLGGSETITETVQGVYTVLTASNCCNTGTAKYTATFQSEHFTTQVKNVTLPVDPDKHNPGSASYTWDDAQCTASVRCTRNPQHVTATETVQGVYSVVTEANCTYTGSAKYTATFQSQSFATQVKNITLPVDPNKHVLGEASYTWDGTQCTASAPCSYYSTHAVTTETVQAVAGSVVEDTVCYTVTCYNATFENSAFAAQTKEFESSKQSHEFVDNICTKCGYCDIFELNQNSYLILKSGCSAPANLRIPRMGVGICGNVFANNMTLTSVVIQSNIKLIDGEAFKYCKNLATLVLPVGLLKIDNNAFEQCTSLQVLNLPQGLQYIGSAAFHTCSSISTLTIPSSLTFLGISSFGSCSGLEELVIENGLGSISSWSFSNCTSLEEVTLPVSVTSIGEHVFHGCTSLADIYYAGTRAQWNSVAKGSDWNYNCPANMVIHCSDD